MNYYFGGLQDARIFSGLERLEKSVSFIFLVPKIELSANWNCGILYCILFLPFIIVFF